MFNSFYVRKGHYVRFESEISTDVERVSENVGLHMSVFDWIGACAEQGHIL